MTACRALLLAVLTLAGCSKVKSVEVAPAELTLTEPGQTARLTAVAKDSDGAPVPGAALAFTSSAPEIASVDNEGIVKAFQVGDAVVKATFEGKISGEAKVKVSLPFAISVVPDTVTLEGIGAQAKIAATVRDEKGREVPGAELSWENAAPNVISVSRGEFTSVGIGEAQVYAVAGAIKAPVRVVVAPPTLSTLEVQQPPVLKAGEPFKLSVDAKDPNGKPAVGASFSYESSDPKVVAVDVTGVLTPVKKGKAKLTVRSGAKSAEVEVEVAVK